MGVSEVVVTPLPRPRAEAVSLLCSGIFLWFAPGAHSDGDLEVSAVLTFAVQPFGRTLAWT